LAHYHRLTNARLFFGGVNCAVTPNPFGTVAAPLVRDHPDRDGWDVDGGQLHTPQGKAANDPERTVWTT